MSAQTNKDRTLDARQQNIVMISALTATGDLEHLRTAIDAPTIFRFKRVRASGDSS